MQRQVQQRTTRHSSSRTGVAAAGRQQGKQVKVQATRNSSSGGLVRPVRPVRMTRPGIPKIVAFDLDGTMW